MASIYGIRCLSTGEVYIGSTIDFKKRQRDHKAPSNGCISKQIIERGNYEFYIIEECDVEQKLIRERFHIENTDCINKRVPLRTKKEYKDSHKEEIKEYRNLHKDERKYYDKHRYQLNKEQIKQKHSEIINCECGCKITKGRLSTHRKSTKHRENMIKNKITL
jgi:group I intron endonuclease